MQEEQVTVSAKELTPEEIAHEQLRAQYYDLLSFMNMMLKQGNGHGYFNRTDEVQKFREFRKKMEEQGTPIPDLVQNRTASIFVRVDFAMDDKMAEEIKPSGSEFNFETFWQKNVGKDKRRFLKFMRDVNATIGGLYSSYGTISTKTELGEWPNEDIYKVGQQVMDEIKAARETPKEIA
jgi:hypothetical protein